MSLSNDVWIKALHKFKLLLHGQGGNSWGGGGAGGAVAHPTFGQQHIFSGFSHTTDRKVPSEVVLMGSFMSVIMLMSDKTAIFQLKSQ